MTTLFCPLGPMSPQLPATRDTGQSPLHVGKLCWTLPVSTQTSWRGGVPDTCPHTSPEATLNILQASGVRLGKGVVPGPRTQEADSLPIQMLTDTGVRTHSLICMCNVYIIHGLLSLWPG